MTSFTEFIYIVFALPSIRGWLAMRTLLPCLCGPAVLSSIVFHSHSAPLFISQLREIGKDLQSQAAANPCHQRTASDLQGLAGNWGRQWEGSIGPAPCSCTNSDATAFGQQTNTCRFSCCVLSTSTCSCFCFYPSAVLSAVCSQSCSNNYADVQSRQHQTMSIIFVLVP